MTVETRRRLFGRFAALGADELLKITGLGATALLFSACVKEALEDPQNLREIRAVEEAQRRAMEKIKETAQSSQEKERDAVKKALKKERFIPLPKVEGVAVEDLTESAGYGALAIKLPKQKGKFIFPSLVGGNVLGLHDDLGTGVSTISVLIDNLVMWQFEARAKPLITRGGEKIFVGQPLFEYDLEAADENLHKIRGYVRGFLAYSYPFANGSGSINQSDVTRDNVLVDPQRDGKFREISALRFAA